MIENGAGITCFVPFGKLSEHRYKVSFTIVQVRRAAGLARNQAPPRSGRAPCREDQIAGRDQGEPQGRGGS